LEMNLAHAALPRCTNRRDAMAYKAWARRFEAS
jgi:hypothetical protein